MESSYPPSAHSALGFAADVTSHPGDSRQSASRSALGLVAPCNGRLSASPGSRSMARMVTGEVFLTRSRLEERPPDPEVADESDEAQIMKSFKNVRICFAVFFLLSFRITVIRCV